MKIIPDIQNLNVFNNKPSKFQEFLLKLKDEPVIKFTIEFVDDVIKKLEVHKVYSFNDLPVGLVPESVPTLDWLRTRFVPKNREFVNEILNSMGTNDEPRLLSLLKITLGLSLTDSFWVLPFHSYHLKWKDYNLFSNPFSEVLSLIAFTGHEEVIPGLVSSPEFTTNGMLRKCWRRNSKGIIELYKGGTSGYLNAGGEPYAEYYAAQIASLLGINHVFYRLEKWKGELCSVCPIFTSENLSFIPAASFLTSETILDWLRDHKELQDMAVFDMVIGNHDRHFGNFGVLRTSNRDHFIAPAFDHGLSLMHQALGGDWGEYSQYFEYRKIGFLGIEWNNYDRLTLFLNHELRSKLRQLLNFSFQPHPQFPLTEFKLRGMSNFVRTQVRGLLGTKSY